LNELASESRALFFGQPERLDEELLGIHCLKIITALA
jgi:hypothetical protein